MEFVGESVIDFVLIGDSNGGALYRLLNGELYRQSTRAPKLASAHPAVKVWQSRAKYYLDFGGGSLIPVERITFEKAQGSSDGRDERRRFR